MASHANGVAEAIAEGKHLCQPRQQPQRSQWQAHTAAKELRWCNGWQLGCDKMVLKYWVNPRASRVSAVAGQVQQHRVLG